MRNRLTSSILLSMAAAAAREVMRKRATIRPARTRSTAVLSVGLGADVASRVMAQARSPESSSAALSLVPGIARRDAGMGERRRVATVSGMTVAQYDDEAAA